MHDLDVSSTLLYDVRCVDEQIDKFGGAEVFRVLSRNGPLLGSNGLETHAFPDKSNQVKMSGTFMALSV